MKYKCRKKNISLSLSVEILILSAFIISLIFTGSCTYTSEQPKTKGRDIRVTFIHTTDIHSRILPFEHATLYTEEKLGMSPDKENYGGIARIASVIKEERKKAGRLLHLDSGDLFQGAPIFNLFHGEPEIKAMSHIGLNAFVLGNHEFDAGPENVISKFEQFADFQVLCANYIFQETTQPFAGKFHSLVKPYAVFNLQGITVGVIGMSNLSSMTSLEDGGNSLGVLPLDTLQTVQDYINVLRPQVDLVVMLSHLGLHNDEYVARNACGLDLILGGHHHVALAPPKIIPYAPEEELADEYDFLGKCSKDLRRDVIMVHSQAFAKFMGRLDIVMHDGRIKAHKYELIPIDSDLPDDGDTWEVLEPYYEEMLRTYDLYRIVAHAIIDLRRFGSGGGDSMLGNFAAEAIQYRSGVETDFSVTNSLGIRTDISKGPITIETMFNVMPFENTITTMYLSGDEIQEMLDFVTTKSSTRGCSCQVQVSNISFDMNCSINKAENIVIAGNSMRRDAIYEMATNNYMAWGGSGFDVLERNTTKIDTGISLRDAIIDFMKAHPELPECYEEMTFSPLDFPTKEEYELELEDYFNSCRDGLAVEDGRIRAVY